MYYLGNSFNTSSDSIIITSTLDLCWTSERNKKDCAYASTKVHGTTSSLLAWGIRIVFQPLAVYKWSDAAHVSWIRWRLVSYWLLNGILGASSPCFAQGVLLMSHRQIYFRLVNSNRTQRRLVKQPISTTNPCLCPADYARFPPHRPSLRTTLFIQNVRMVPRWPQVLDMTKLGPSTENLIKDSKRESDMDAVWVRWVLLHTAYVRQEFIYVLRVPTIWSTLLHAITSVSKLGPAVRTATYLLSYIAFHATQHIFRNPQGRKEELRSCARIRS